MADVAWHDWGLATHDRTRRRAAVVAVSIGAIAGAIGAAIASISGSTPWLGFALGVLAFSAYAGTRARSALRRAGASRIPADSQPRFTSLVVGLAGDLGIRLPNLWMYEDGGPNALVCRVGGGAIVVSRTAISELTRTELEALVAHCLIRLANGGTLGATIACLGHIVAVRLGAIVNIMDDARSAALTRYPPALVSALEKSDPAAGRFGPYYFVATGPSHAPVADRIAALSDL